MGVRRVMPLDASLRLDFLSSWILFCLAGSTGACEATTPVQGPARPAPVSVTSAEPAATPTTPEPVPISPAAAADLLEQANACYADPSCKLNSAARLFEQAADAGAAGTPCAWFDQGVGVDVDSRRARACLRKVIDASCGDQSPSVERASLAIMALAGRGGPRDPALATALLEGCFEDSVVLSIRSAMNAEAPLANATTFCDAFAMTTLHMNMCAYRSVAASKRRLEVAVKKHPGLARSNDALEKANAAFSSYAEAGAAWQADAYRGGTMSRSVHGLAIHRLYEARANRLAGLSWELPKRASVVSAKPKAAVDTVAKKLLAELSSSFEGYRHAEVALYEKALQPEPPQAAKLEAWLSAERSVVEGRTAP